MNVHPCRWCRCADDDVPGVGRLNPRAPFYGLVLEVDRLLAEQKRDKQDAARIARQEVAT